MSVLFDLDGTVLDTPAGIVRVVGDTLSALGRPAADEAVVRRLIGKPLVDLFGAFLPEAEVPAAIAAFRTRFTATVVSQARELVFPGLIEVLDALAADYRIAIATSKVHASAVEILAAAGLLDRFDVVAGADDVSRPKPAPDLALFAAARLDARPQECVVVGDSVHDIAMAVAAGMTGVGVTWGVDSASALFAAGATAVVSTTSELGTVVAGLLDGRPRPSTPSVVFTRE